MTTTGASRGGHGLLHPEQAITIAVNPIMIMAKNRRLFIAEPPPNIRLHLVIIDTNRFPSKVSRQHAAISGMMNVNAHEKILRQKE
jgi:hypothetical protein